MKKIVLLLGIFMLLGIQSIDAKVYNYNRGSKSYHKVLQKSQKKHKNYGRFKSTIWKGYYKGLNTKKLKL